MPVDPPYRVDYRLEAQADRLDRSVFHSAPDSLHLDAACHGEGLYRFRAVVVKPGVKYRLSFHYLNALGGHARCSVRVAQYGDGVLSLGGGTLTRRLPVVGRWQAEAVDFVALPGAETVEVDFRLEYEVSVGETWVDDVVLRPVGVPVTVGP